MTQQKIVNIKFKNYTQSEEQLIKIASREKSFEFKFIPAVAFNKKNEEADASSPSELIFYQDKCAANNKENNFAPYVFSLYEFGTSLTLLRSYTSDIINSQVLQSVKQAFRQLKRIVSKCSERIISDLCCNIILKILQENHRERITFFIISPMSDKMLGHLGTLYLNLRRVTIVFLATRPTDLMTTVMSQHTRRIRFDLHRLMSEDSDEMVGPYPGDSEKSLTQTYFYKPKPIPSEDKGSYRPIRLDIFSQGLSLKELEDKKEELRKLLKPGSSNTETDEKTGEPRLLQPNGFNFLNKKLELHKEEFSELLEQ